jgi:hypothetical protein
MSPEQLRASKGADERSDIWALGVILYELLTGVLPFHAESVTQLIAMVLSEDPRPIRELRADVPAGLGRVVERCLKKDPAGRFTSVAELAAALAPFAPSDSRGLATRIARITAGNRLPPSSAAMATPMPSAHAATTASWSAQAEHARSTRGKVVAIVAVTAVFGALAVIGTMGAFRLTRNATPTQATGLATSIVPSAAVPQRPAPAPVTASATEVIAVATSDLTVARGPVPLADGGTSRPVRPHPDLVAPADTTPPSETPKYRTSW